MPRYLICNADDFGIGRRITDAILDCHKSGIITSTTLMANMPAAEYACRRAREYPELGIGLHLNLTAYRPLSPPEQVKDLVDETGNFLSSSLQVKNLWRGRHLAEQVEKEYSAQIEKALELGIQPTHFDGHHGIQKRPLARKALIKLAQKYHIPAARTQRGFYWTAPNAAFSLKLMRRHRNLRAGPRIFMRYWNHCQLRRGNLLTPERTVNPSLLLPCCAEPKQKLLNCIAAIPEGISELVFHPGYPDPDVNDTLKFAEVRKTEAKLSCDPDIIAALKDNGIQLITFKDIGNLS